MLTVIGFPRSGTNFLTRLLAHYIDGPAVNVWPGTPAHSKVNKIHWAYQDDGSRTLVYIYRDPRDCALSGWEYIKHHFAPNITLMGFLERHFSGNWGLWPTGWQEHTSHWLGLGIATVCYEELCDNRGVVLRGLIETLGLPMSEIRIAYALSQSYNFGKRNDGRWVDELPADAVAWIDDYCGDLMQELGYIER